MLQSPCFTCINGVYVAIYGHLNLIFTQDAQEARKIACQMGSSAEPYWWTEETRVTEDNLNVALQTIQEIEKLLGAGGLREFTALLVNDTLHGKEYRFLLRGFAC